MFKAKRVTVFMPVEGETQVFENVEFQSSPEINLISIFTDKGRKSIMFSGLNFQIDMHEDDC